MKILWSLCVCLLSVSCSENLFDEIADKDAPEAIYFQAKQEINSRNYGAAITLLESLDPTYLAARERVAVYASAYSGRCGLEFLTLLNNLQNSSTGTIFATLMAAFPGATVAENVADCNQSQSILSGVGDQSARDGDENLLMAFTSLAEIGTLLSALADTDDNGSADAGFDQCDNSDFSDSQVRELGSSIALTILSLGAIGTSYIDDALADINSLCGIDPELATFCSVTDPAAFTADQVRALRWAIGSNDIGIDSCGGNDFANCALANPACP